MNFERHPRTNQHQQEQPDAPGIWHFTGIVYISSMRGESVRREPELELVKTPIKVVQEGDQFTVTDPDSGVPFGGEWVGWWEREKEI